MQIILASASPRRAELLGQLVNDFVVHPSHIDEQQQAHESPAEYVQRLASDKALAVAKTVAQTALVLGSDTLIDVNGEVMEKPLNQQHFDRMLRRLAGQVHQVRTGVAVVAVQAGRFIKQRQLEVVTDVTMGAISDAQRDAYWATGEPQDKAGGYAIQGGAARFVKAINGSYTAVVGLPLYETNELIQQGLNWLESSQ